MTGTLSTGSSALDKLLDGGYEHDCITTIYGPSGSGKTNLCLLAMLSAVKKGKVALFLDSDGGFSIKRLEQITKDKKVLEQTFFHHPLNFQEQQEIIRKLNDQITDKIGVIIIDSIGMLYRLEMGRKEDVYEINHILSEQISLLTGIARQKKIPIIMTNQVYSDFGREGVKMVGGDIVRYGSKCLIELQSGHNGIRKAIIRKHRSIPEGRELKFRIVQEGIEELDE